MVKFTKAHRLALSKAAKAGYAGKTKKRGVKPGTKRGKYKRNKQSINLEQCSDIFNKADAKIGETLRIRLPKDFVVKDSPKEAYTPAPILTLCGQLEDAILLLENRVSNAIAKINSLM
jgi:hypothetical protein